MDATVETSGKDRRPGWILRLVGKVLLTCAAIMGAYIIWLLWGTGLIQGREQDQLQDDLNARIEAAAAAPEVEQPPPLPGQAYARLRIPALDMNQVVIEGVATEDLQKGPGHYPKSEDPWDGEGRVAIAGHRTTYGAPFWDLDKLGRGDLIHLETQLGVYEYMVDRTEIVAPSARYVTDEETPNEATLVLTTCNPRFSAAERLIVFADRVAPV